MHASQYDCTNQVFPLVFTSILLNYGRVSLENTLFFEEEEEETLLSTSHIYWSLKIKSSNSLQLVVCFVFFKAVSIRLKLLHIVSSSSFHSEECCFVILKFPKFFLEPILIVLFSTTYPCMHTLSVLCLCSGL